MFLNTYAQTQFVCAFCDNLISESIGYCETCNRIDGAVTIAQYEKMFGSEY